MFIPRKKRVPVIQTPDTRGVSREDHVWYLLDDGRWKCCLCGGIDANPPTFPTPDNYIPPEYELPLTDGERKICPNPNT